MELLGQERANYLFNRLNRQDQDKVLQFINQGGYGTQKYQKMLESGENLKTKLLQGAFHVKKGLENRNILENLLTMAEGDIANLAVDFDQEHLARLFLYLDPAKSAGVLQSIYRQNQDVFDKAISAIPQIPNFVEKRDLDQRIEQSISKYKETQANDAQLPYLQHYYNLITSMDENLTELTLERMSQSSERVGNFLKEKVVTFALLFELNDEQQADLVNKLNNKDIAILLVALDKDLADQVKRQVPQRRQDMLTEELESLSGLANNKLALLLKTVKTKVVKDLQSLKAKGEISKKTSPINTEDNQSQAA
jgi:Mg/Co/Ni transporter MgtE